VSEVKVFLGGEGGNELGSRCGDPTYQDGGNLGVIETLLRGVQSTGWSVIGAKKWCQIRKLRSKGPTPREERNVLGLAHEAERAQARVLAFVRDADDDRNRPKVIADAIGRAEDLFPKVTIIGSVAIPVLEGWILAMLGEHGTEKLGKAAAQSKLVAKGIARRDTGAMVNAATKVALDRLPKDATSLRAWLTRAEEVLPLLVKAS
jgi:hypothetical protein